MQSFRRLLKEPLFHFVVLATILFTVTHFFKGDRAASAAPDQIVVSEGRILNLVQMWQRTWQRPPSADELNGLINDYIKEEVLYRQATKMGLDEDDTIIRRRLQQKLEFLAEDLADSVEPSDEELQQFLEQNAEQFETPSTTTFRHIYFDPDKRGDRLQGNIENVLQKLQSEGDSADPADFGDRFLLPYAYQRATPRELENTFGPEFPQQLAQLDANQWLGPISSGYGQHLVLVEEREATRAPALEEVRPAVRREWHASRRAESKERFYEDLRKQYEIVVEMPEFEATESEDTP